MARPIKFSKSTVKEKNIIQLGTFQVFSLPSIPGSPSMFLFVQLFPSNFLSIVWSWYTSVYGGVNFRPQIVHSHLSIDISNYRPGSYNTSDFSSVILSLSPIGPYHRRILMRDPIRLFKSRPSGCVSMTWY